MIRFDSFLILSEYCLSLATAYTFKRKKTSFSGMFKSIIETLHLRSSCPFPFSPREAHPQLPSSPFSHSSLPCLPVQDLRRKSKQPRAPWMPTVGSPCGGIQPVRPHRHSSCSIFFLNGTSGHEKHPVPLGPQSSGWSKPLGTFRSQSHVMPTNVR